MEKLILPKHIAIIMDGNRRWAKKHHLSVFEGHRGGEKRIEPIIDHAIKLGIPFLSFWAFSTENWYRSGKEVRFLLNLFRYILDKKISDLHRKNVKFQTIGDISKFPIDIQEKTKKWVDKTKNNTSITVNFALNYGGRDEILRAIEKWYASSKFNPPAGGQNSKLSEKEFETYLDTAGQPDPDLLIRTGGEMRLSGFLLWQTEYTELYFTKAYWPDFTDQKFREALREYGRRQRRFGK